MGVLSVFVKLFQLKKLMSKNFSQKNLDLQNIGAIRYYTLSANSCGSTTLGNLPHSTYRAQVWCTCSFTCCIESNLCTIVWHGGITSANAIMVNGNSTLVYCIVVAEVDLKCEAEVPQIYAFHYWTKASIRIELKPSNTVALWSCPRLNVTAGYVGKGRV